MSSDEEPEEVEKPSSVKPETNTSKVPYSSLLMIFPEKGQETPSEPTKKRRKVLVNSDSEPSPSRSPTSAAKKEVPMSYLVVVICPLLVV